MAAKAVTWLQALTQAGVRELRLKLGLGWPPQVASQSPGCESFSAFLVSAQWPMAFTGLWPLCEGW